LDKGDLYQKLQIFIGEILAGGKKPEKQKCFHLIAEGRFDGKVILNSC
jgi:hypothetical protein